jgi:soluble P-type ATPase
MAIEGKLIAGVKELLEMLSSQLTIHVLTADTFGNARHEISAIGCNLEIIDSAMQEMQKEHYVTRLGKDHVIAIGNGANDSYMMWQAALSILVIQQEGACANLFSIADVVCLSIADALKLLLNPMRMTATLRK